MGKTLQSLTLNSYAKLNLYLAVLSKRRDNFHELETVFERISLCDKITLTSRKDSRITLNCSEKKLCSVTSNLAYKSAKILKEKFKIKTGVNIELEKRIPVGSGMGGGSSNAATVLLGLNRLWGLGLSKDELARIAQELGSDVAFFVYECSFALAQGRGEIIKPMEEFKKASFWHVLVVPKIHVSTPLIYKEWDKLKSRDNALTIQKKNVKILCLGLKKKDINLLRKGIYNNLEPVTTKLYPQVNRVKKRLDLLGIPANLMSGSGSSVFGLVSNRKEAVKLSKQLCQENEFWQVFVVKTV